MKSTAIFAVLLCLSTNALAQEKTIDQKPLTEVEAFLRTKGQIIVKEFHELRSISGEYGSHLTIGTLILYDPGSPSKKRKGLRIVVKEGGRLERENISFLDVEEIEALSKGLTYMNKVANEWKGKPREYTEMIFSTKGDFQVGFYINKEGDLGAFAKSGLIGSTSVHLDQDSMGFLKKAADDGLVYLSAR
ncbi:MAG: hypothetical protein OJF50_000944 [Nitrospira sp.]|jgi:hypothetical protein|nr:hypothetical protein [Nitrospira sp.]